MGKNTWNSKDVPLFSDIWNEVKQKLLNDSHLSDRFEIENASIEITLPDQLTIKIPYALADKYVDDKKLPDKENGLYKFRDKQGFN